MTNVICSPTVGYLVCVLWGADEPEPSAGQRGTGFQNYGPAENGQWHLGKFRLGELQEQR